MIKCHGGETLLYISRRFQILWHQDYALDYWIVPKIAEQIRVGKLSVLMFRF